MKLHGPVHHLLEAPVLLDGDSSSISVDQSVFKISVEP